MKWLRLSLFAVAVVVLPFVVFFCWEVYCSFGTAVPGTSAFRTYFDSAHGMASTSGTFKLAGGEKIYLDCWSPGRLMRDEFVKFVIYRPSRMGDKTKDTLTIKADAITLTFEGSYGEMLPEQRTTFWPDDDMTREQLREIASAHQVVLWVGKESPLELSGDQLADIRAFLAYTDKLPEFNPLPQEMRTNSP